MTKIWKHFLSQIWGFVLNQVFINKSSFYLFIVTVFFYTMNYMLLKVSSITKGEFPLFNILFLSKLNI